MDLDVAEGYKWRLETLSRDMLTLETSSVLDQHESTALEYLLKSYSIIAKVVEKLERQDRTQPCQPDVPVISHKNVGRPQFDISFSSLKTYWRMDLLYQILLAFWMFLLVLLDEE